MSYFSYQHYGIDVPRVSTICSLLSKPFLYAWNNKMGLDGINTKDYVNATAEIGTSIHESVQHYMMFESEDKFNEELSGKSDKDKSDILYGFKKYIESGENKNISEAQCEISFTSEKCGGRIDVISKYKNDRAILDIKTSNQVTLSHKIQLGAYVSLLEENKVSFDKQGILLIPVRSEKKAKIYWYSDDEMKFYKAMFDGLLNVYAAQELLKEWKKCK